MVRGRFVVLMHICVFSLAFCYADDNYTSLDSQRRMLSNKVKYVNVAKKK